MAKQTDLMQAIEAAQAGDWDAAHMVAQRHEGEAMADWLHAVLHRIEGDMPNAEYWYARAGKSPTAYEQPADELATIRSALGQ